MTIVPKTTKLQSPCKDCDKSPCPRPQDCKEKWDYVEKLGEPGLQAVDQGHGYRILPK